MIYVDVNLTEKELDVLQGFMEADTTLSYTNKINNKVLVKRLLKLSSIKSTTRMDALISSLSRKNIFYIDKDMIGLTNLGRLIIKEIGFK